VLLLLQRLAEVGVYIPHRTHPAAAAAAGTQDPSAAAAAGGVTADDNRSAHAPETVLGPTGALKSCLKGGSSSGGPYQQQQQQQDRSQQNLRHGVKSAGGSSVIKAIVFSQFWMHVQLIAAELSARGVPHIVLKRDMSARDKQAAVMEFRARQHSCCLVMDASGGCSGLVLWIRGEEGFDSDSVDTVIANQG
jgi:hypothetical protein